MKNKLFLYGLGGASGASVAFGFWRLTRLWHSGRAADGARMLAVGFILGGFALAFGWLLALGQGRAGRVASELEPADPKDPS